MLSSVERQHSPPGHEFDIGGLPRMLHQTGEVAFFGDVVGELDSKL
jgi:hypothetical protein